MIAQVLILDNLLQAIRNTKLRLQGVTVFHSSEQEKNQEVHVDKRMSRKAVVHYKYGYKLYNLYRR